MIRARIATGEKQNGIRRGQKILPNEQPSVYRRSSRVRRDVFAVLALATQPRHSSPVVEEAPRGHAAEKTGLGAQVFLRADRWLVGQLFFRQRRKNRLPRGRRARCARHVEQHAGVCASERCVQNDHDDGPQQVRLVS